MSDVLENGYLLVISALKIMFVFLWMCNIALEALINIAAYVVHGRRFQDSCLVQVGQVGDWQGEQEQLAERNRAPHSVLPHPRNEMKWCGIRVAECLSLGPQWPRETSENGKLVSGNASGESK